jgi:N-acetylneuraminic acid mutarotase
MKKSYSYFFKQFRRPLSGLILKFCFAPLILVIFHLQVLAQDFTTISWSTAASQRYPVSEAQGKVVNGKLYSFGGFDSQKSTWTPTKRAYVYNPVVNTWSRIADLPFTPNGTNYGGVTHAGVATDGTNIYIAGGYTSSTSGTGQIFGTKQAWKYIVSQNSYTKLPDLPISISGGQLEYLGGKLHYIGGTNSSRTLDLGNHYVLDLSNLSSGWKTLAALPNPRHHAGSAVYGGKIYFIGGQHHHDGNLVTQRDVHAYNPSTNTWTKLANLPVPTGASGRGHISSAVAVMGDRILVLGGEIDHNASINMVSAYSPGTNSWKNLTPLPKSRFSGVAGVMNNRIYYTGGSRSSTTYKGTPGSGSQTNITLSPVADAFVRNGSYAAKNYGGDPYLVVKTATSSGYTRSSYLKFSLSNVSSISSAKLRIYGRNVDNTKTISLSSYGVNNDSWTKVGITFNNAPATSTSAFTFCRG